MKIKIATHNDELKWDNFVDNHPKASPYHRFAWKKSIQESYSHTCYYLIAEGEINQVIGVLPAVLINPPFSKAQLCSLPFCDRGESLAFSTEVEKALIEKAIELAEHHSAVYEYRSTNEHYVEDPKNLIQGQKVRMLLELPESSDILLRGFKAKLRSQIKKAEKNGLEFEVGNDASLIDAFYDVFTVNMKDLGSPTHSKSWFEEINKNYRNNMVISIVKHDNKTIAAGIVLMNGTVASIPWASTKREYNRLAPNMLLYWSLLQFATDNGSTVFDFGRSSYGEGTYKFKQQWGAKPVLLDWKTFSKKQPDPMQQPAHGKSNLRSLVESIWSRLPLPMTVLLGSRIRKYISL